MCLLKLFSFYSLWEVFFLAKPTFNLVEATIKLQEFKGMKQDRDEINRRAKPYEDYMMDARLKGLSMGAIRTTAPLAWIN